MGSAGDCPRIKCGTNYSQHSRDGYDFVVLGPKALSVGKDTLLLQQLSWQKVNSNRGCFTTQVLPKHTFFHTSFKKTTTRNKQKKTKKQKNPQRSFGLSDHQDMSQTKSRVNTPLLPRWRPPGVREALGPQLAFRRAARGAGAERNVTPFSGDNPARGHLLRPLGLGRDWPFKDV